MDLGVGRVVASIGSDWCYPREVVTPQVVRGVLTLLEENFPGGCLGCKLWSEYVRVRGAPYQLTVELAERETHAAVSFVGLEEGARQPVGRRKD